MDSEAVLNNLIEEMRNKGSLPALNETVLEISRLARKQDSSAPDLAAVIMRDCGLASSLLATVNSADYARRLPVQTISAAVTYLGFDKVYLRALGLGLFRHTMASLQKRKLLKLYATSYFSGTLAMSLAYAGNLDSPEEVFIAGLLYRLPGMSLAHTFPDHFLEMETLINEKGLTLNQACLEIFKLRYDVICDAVLALYHLPEAVEQHIGSRGLGTAVHALWADAHAACLSGADRRRRPGHRPLLRRTVERRAVQRAGVRLDRSDR